MSDRLSIPTTAHLVYHTPCIRYDQLLLLPSTILSDSRLSPPILRYSAVEQTTPPPSSSSPSHRLHRFASLRSTHNVAAQRQPTHLKRRLSGGLLWSDGECCRLPCPSSFSRSMLCDPLWPPRRRSCPAAQLPISHPHRSRATAKGEGRVGGPPIGGGTPQRGRATGHVDREGGGRNWCNPVQYSTAAVYDTR